MAPKKNVAVAAAPFNRKTQKIADVMISWVFPILLATLSVLALLSKTIGRTNRKRPPTYAFEYWCDDHLSSFVPLVFPLLAWGASSARHPALRRAALAPLFALLAVATGALLPAFPMEAAGLAAVTTAVGWAFFTYNPSPPGSAPAPAPLPVSAAVTASRLLLVIDGSCLLLLAAARVVLPRLSPALVAVLPSQPQVALATAVTAAVGLLLLAGGAGIVQGELGQVKTMMWIGFLFSLSCTDLLSSSTLPAFAPTIFAWTARALAAAHLYAYAQPPLSTAAVVWVRRQTGMMTKLGGLETMGVE